MNKNRIKDDMHPTQFLLDKDTHKKLRVAAIEEGISMGEALRQAVSLWLKARKKMQKATRKED
jgi:hypothetical protein